jgi:hypothetical protein
LYDPDTVARPDASDVRETVTDAARVITAERALQSPIA